MPSNSGSGAQALADTLDREIETLFNALPYVSCEGCGGCCVSPACTLAEYLYLMRRLTRSLPEKAAAFLAAEPASHPEYEGCTRCFFLHGTRCTLYAMRTGACRLFGLDEVEKSGVPGMVTCRHKKGPRGKSVPGGLARWAEGLAGINEKLHPFGEAPLFVTGLTLECWNDLYFAQSGLPGAARPMVETLRAGVDLSRWAGQYRAKTGIAEKMAAVETFMEQLDTGNRPKLSAMLAAIRRDHKNTGTYFENEAARFAEALEG